MVSIKVKCDADYHPYGTKSELTTVMAVEAKWYEIEIHPATISWRQPKTSDSFKVGLSHACSAEHAIEVMDAALNEQIMKVTPKNEPQAISDEL